MHTDNDDSVTVGWISATSNQVSKMITNYSNLTLTTNSRSWMMRVILSMLNSRSSWTWTLTRISFGMHLVICMAQPWTVFLLTILNLGRHLQGPLQMHPLHNGLVQMFSPTMQSAVGWKFSYYDLEIVVHNVLLQWVYDCYYWDSIYKDVLLLQWLPAF